MAEGVAVTDQRGDIIYTNPALDAMFGYEPGELLGRHSNILNFDPPEEEPPPGRGHAAPGQHHRLLDRGIPQLPEERQTLFHARPHQCA